ncbi:reverse transcriptase N-terminal domain-containing protein [Kitasatospora aureofaciens]
MVERGCRSNTLVSVKRVTQQSSGRMTAGIDGERALTPAARGKLAADGHSADASMATAAARSPSGPRRGEGARGFIRLAGGGGGSSLRVKGRLRNGASSF